MPFKRMVIEDWFDEYQFKVDFDIGESGVKWTTPNELGLDFSQVGLRYGHHLGAPELREMIAGTYDGLSSEHIAVTTGASEAIFAVVAGLVGPDEEILIEHPNYPSHYSVAASLGKRHRLYRLDFANQFKLDLGKLEQMITAKTKLVSLTHPNNPTGSTLSADELASVVRMVEAKNAYLLVDETYRELSYTVPPPPAACLSPRAISVSTMSKAYGVPGIRIGWAAVADRAIIDMIRAVREQVTICNSAIGEYAALRILECKDALLAATRRHVLDNLECLSSWMQERDDLEWIPPAAGVVAFPRLKHGSSADAVCRRLVEGYRTFTVPGTCFDMPRHFRVGYGGTAHELSHGLECLKAALEDTRAVPAGGVRVH